MSIPASTVFEDETHLDEMSENAKRATALLKALGHEGRLMILCYLASGEKSVTALEDLLSLRQPAVSQQLARLRADNIISPRRDGKTIYYSISDERARRLMEVIYELFCQEEQHG
jgi:DNA-binding transcriptional ArsR family regulator